MVTVVVKLVVEVLEGDDDAEEVGVEVPLVDTVEVGVEVELVVGLEVIVDVKVVVALMVGDVESELV